MQVAQQRKQAEMKQLEIEKTLQDNDRKIQERKAQLLEKRHAAEEREAKLRQDKDKEAMLRRRREQQRQQEIEMHIQAQKEEEDKKKQQTLDKLQLQEQMVQSSFKKKNQILEQKRKQATMKELEKEQGLR